MIILQVIPGLRNQIITQEQEFSCVSLLCSLMESTQNKKLPVRPDLLIVKLLKEHPEFSLKMTLWKYRNIILIIHI